MSQNTDKSEIIEQFLEYYPDNFEDQIEEVCLTGTGSIKIRLNSNRVMCPRITEPLLENGWVLTSTTGSNHYFFKRLNIEEKEITRTITETKTVATTRDI